MAKPPESTKTSLRQKLAARARERWPQLAGITVRWHGQFAYVGGQLTDGSTLPLFRLRYAGSATTWGFAIYRASHDDYETSVLPSGYPAGTPQEALDCACGLYLGDHTAWITQQPPDGLTGAPTSGSHAYWIFTAMATQVYLIIYVLMFVAAVKLRRSQPDHARGYGAPALSPLCLLSIASSIAALGIGFIPPSQFGHSNPLAYALLILAGIFAIGILPPLLLDRLRKPAWKVDGDARRAGLADGPQ